METCFSQNFFLNKMVARVSFCIDSVDIIFARYIFIRAQSYMNNILKIEHVKYGKLI